MCKKSNNALIVKFGITTAGNKYSSFGYHLRLLKITSKNSHNHFSVLIVLEIS